MNGFSWNFVWKDKPDKTSSGQKNFYVTATRYQYIVKRPIVDPSNKKIIMNFYPINKKTLTPQTMLEMGDSKGLFDKFFRTV